MAGSFSLTRDGRQLAFVASSPTSLNEVFTSDLKEFLASSADEHD